MSWYRRGGKRGFDLLVAVPVFVLTLPVMLVVGLLVRLKLGSPVLFRQQRPGRHGEVFTLTKFRTMTDAVDENGLPLPDKDRLTQFGAFLRSTSLDELPELWHVFTGEMSLVGPRPLRVRYLARYTAEQARRHEVRPGITGWAQVNGRNNAPWPERLSMDVWYVDNLSLGRDLQILWRTLVSVVRRADVAEDGQVTARELLGPNTIAVTSDPDSGHHGGTARVSAAQDVAVSPIRLSGGRNRPGPCEAQRSPGTQPLDGAPQSRGHTASSVGDPNCRQ